MLGPGFRIIAIAVLTVLASALVAAAVVLLLRDEGNEPIKIYEARDEPDPQVYISGAVLKPGVYTLRPGDRLEDALQAAGGATSEADLSAVNLARRVQDEGHYDIPEVGATPRPSVEKASVPGLPDASSGEVASIDGKLIDLNTATVQLLETLPGIGPSRAKAIVDYRNQNGCFQETHEVLKVKGIGTATYEGLQELVEAENCP
ncbi:MAG: helix-hairpin-helix domain-containing protein [Chloroflexi bacterium]|nr:helix-hairpin-helix domain-containing protein [Chloroflexota bacterium]